jgi:hypothetical protein
MILSLITPVLASLTVAYSDDTIILDYLIFVLVHLVYYDFEIIGKKPVWMEAEVIPSTIPTLTGSAGSGAKVATTEKKDGTSPQKKKTEPISMSVQHGKPTSINAIFFASILLASRLKKFSKVFTLLTISLCIFGFTPIFRHVMRHRQRNVYDSYALISSIILGYTIWCSYPLFGIIYICLIVFISLVSPLIFIYAYQFKNDIRGPWDCP